ncbi:hypothetical protein NAPIS_ORF00975 [Vairimorpha apis BRL 01]|uniref:Uncharacterized protein n=1 Tax=Vairimorpha apis BRL 01 TaxID=1037528 RepID=T0MKI9_9MICR|nr:hypothetical protein NAPIS_ORF00975 [Vairimorpha apis BRL 01]
MHGYKTKIIPYVMTWEGIVTTFHKQYRNVLNIDSRTQAYIQARVFKMTLESLSMEARRGKYITEGEQGGNELENLESLNAKVALYLLVTIYKLLKNTIP